MEQLFNTMDPSPFHKKDLDDDAAEFILNWAQEFHRPEPVDLIVHLEKLPDGHDAQRLVEDAVHHYFAKRSIVIWATRYAGRRRHPLHHFRFRRPTPTGAFMR